jgi:hypothetical protein
MDCFLREGSGASPESAMPLADRIRVIDETVDEFAAHLRNVLVRCIKPDMTWNREYGIDEWSDPTDVVAAAYAPGVWYTMRQRLEGRDHSSDGN